MAIYPQGKALIEKKLSNIMKEAPRVSYRNEHDLSYNALSKNSYPSNPENYLGSPET
jgi:hypothetical protein